MTEPQQDTALARLQQDKLHPFDDIEPPRWGKAPDGKHTIISDDERFQQLFNDWRKDACHHPHPIIIRWVNAGSQTVYNWYCQDCGCQLSPGIKSYLAEAHGVTAIAKDSLASRSRAYEAQRRARLDTIVSEAAERAQPGNREEYDDYLRSPAWKRRVAKIMHRAGGVCEGCLTNPAEHVHHLTYAHRGNEFAFELVALCVACHSRIHRQEAAE